MDYEKKYKEALELARVAAFNGHQSLMEGIFPELKESEDERIRKRIIALVNAHGQDMYKGDMLAWLENIPYTIDHEKREGFHLGYKAGLEKQGKQDFRERYKKIAQSEWFKQTHDGMSIGDVQEIEPTDINPSEFDLRLSQLLMQFESLPKEELASSLSFYLNIVQNDGTYKEEKQGEVESDEDDIESEERDIREALNKIWIEKTREKKLVEKVEPKFKVGDWVVSPNGVYWHIDAIQNGRYEVTTDTGQCGNWPLDTNIYRLWTIQDAKDGNVLTNGDFPCIFKRCDGNGSLYVYCGINAHNDFSILSEDPENVWDDYSKQYFPATKEQRDLLFQKMKEAGYEWDAEKKELKKIEDEEYNGEDYGIDSLFHAQRILEKTLGSVDGYQTDDGILSHQCAITAVKKLYEQKPAEWKQENVEELSEFENAMMHIGYSFFGKRGGLDPNDTSSVKVQAQYLLELAQKPAEWSEGDDDDAWMNDIISKVETNLQLNKAEIDWLKSLKQRIGG